MSVKVGLKYLEIWNETIETRIFKYEKQECKKGQIVFYGPSYFTRWSEDYGNIPLEKAILGKSGEPCIINRGFGSSSAEHQLYYYPRVIRPLEPRVLVYSFFANGSAFGYSAEESWELAQRVIAYAKTDFPGIHIYICGPDPRREEHNFTSQGNMDRTAAWIKAFCEANYNCHFIDILANEEIRTRKDIFIDDGVHYNAEGYKIYTEIFKEALKAELEKY